MIIELLTLIKLWQIKLANKSREVNTLQTVPMKGIIWIFRPFPIQKV